VLDTLVRLSTHNYYIVARETPVFPADCQGRIVKHREPLNQGSISSRLFISILIKKAIIQGIKVAPIDYLSYPQYLKFISNYSKLSLSLSLINVYRLSITFPHPSKKGIDDNPLMEIEGETRRPI